MRLRLYTLFTAVCLLAIACKQTANHNTLEASRSKSVGANNIALEDSKPDTPADAARQKMPDFKLPDRAGNLVSVLGDIKNHKLTLIDFWASWCGPCMREVPYVRRAYTTYKDRGLDIVGISLDTDGSRWRQAIIDMDMPWTHVSDLKGWNTQPVRQLGIEGIPFMVLVDSEGYVVAADLRGEQLLEYLEQQLGE